jgi:ABC-type Fe3+ transport system permease subunit
MTKLAVDDLHLSYGTNAILKGVSMQLGEGEVVSLLGPGTEVIGSLLVSLWSTGGADMVAALSLINVVLVAIGLTIALRFGVKLHD